jgi:hypothetical protein
MNLPDSRRVDRRTALKWMATAAAAAAVQPHLGRAQAALPAAKGYGLDPQLNKSYASGDLWPLTFTKEQRRAAMALCAIIIPREGSVPSAAELGVHDFIDEWVSAPYPDQQRDRQPILDGLAWIDAEAGTSRTSTRPRPPPSAMTSATRRTRRATSRRARSSSRASATSAPAGSIPRPKA